MSGATGRDEARGGAAWLRWIGRRGLSGFARTRGRERLARGDVSAETTPPVDSTQSASTRRQGQAEPLCNILHPNSYACMDLASLCIMCGQYICICVDSIWNDRPRHQNTHPPCRADDIPLGICTR